MKVKFVDYSKQYLKIKKEIDFAIQSCLKRGDLILRKDVERFEKNIASFVGSKYAIGVNSGTDALTLALKAIGIQKDDEVITTGYTFWATVEAIYHASGVPILADIKDDLTIDPKSVISKITEKTKAIIPVYIGGLFYDSEIEKIAKKYNLKIIEDAAQGLGCIQTGTIGVASCFSFYPAKVLGGCGDGGAVVTNSKNIDKKIRLLRHHGGKPHPVMIGYNSRLDNIQAAVLNVKLKYLDSWIQRRREIALIYNQELYDLYENSLQIPFSETYQEFNLRVLNGKRDKLYQFLKKKGVETICGDYTFPHQEQRKLKETVRANKEILRLPIWPDLTDKEIYYVCRCIRKFYGI